MTDAADWKRGYRASERSRRAGMVRLYAATTGAVLLAYALINPLFFSTADEVRFSVMLLPALVVLGGYVGLTYWRGYPATPLVDFACLLAVGLLVLGENLVLWNEAGRLAGAHHANVAVNNAIVMVFAALVTTERPRLFLAWLACHAGAFLCAQLVLEPALAGQIFAALSYVTGAAIALFVNVALGGANCEAHKLRTALELERAKTEELLYNVLPEAAARRLRQGQIVADAYSDASVVFIDVVGFTRLASTVSPGHLIEMLNAFFGMADRCAAAHGIEKVKTIGDAYLAVSGGNMPASNSADAAIAFAEAVIDGLGEVREETGLPLHVRVGIHSGPVVGGVIGATRMAYDYWGETMNMASRIEAHARADGLALSESSYLRSRRKERFGPAELVTLKGVGETKVYRSLPPEPMPLALAG
jgi:adenylate cyclase